MSEIRWRDVIDSSKLDFPSSEYTVQKANEFIYHKTHYFYFLFNDVVYKVSYPPSFTMQDCDTGLNTKDIK